METRTAQRHHCVARDPPGKQELSSGSNHVESNLGSGHSMDRRDRVDAIRKARGFQSRGTGSRISPSAEHHEPKPGGIDQYNQHPRVFQFSTFLHSSRASARRPQTNGMGGAKPGHPIEECRWRERSSRSSFGPRSGASVHRPTTNPFSTSHSRPPRRGPAWPGPGKCSDGCCS